MRSTGTLPLRAIGAAALATLVVLVVVAFTGVFRKPFEPATRTIHADFRSAAQVHAGDQVRLEGNVEGRVSGIKQAPDGTAARVTLEVERDAGPLYADARARVRFKTLLGAAMYIDVDRGTPQAGPMTDDVIPLRRTNVQVEIDDVTDVFRGDAVTGMKALPHELAKALENPSAPSGALSTARDIAPDATTALRALRGTAPKTDLRTVVSETARTVEALDTGNDDLTTLVSGAAATVQVTGRRGDEIRAALDEGPTVTSRMVKTLARLDGTLAGARGLVRRLDGPAPDVAPTLKALRPTVQETATLVRRAKPLVRDLRPAVSGLAQAAQSGMPLIDGMRPTLKRIDESILPYLGRKDPITERSTTVMIGGFLSGFGASVGQQDGNGHFIRFPATAGATSVYLPCKTQLVDATAEELLACDSLQTALTAYLGYAGPLQPLKATP